MDSEKGSKMILLVTGEWRRSLDVVVENGQIRSRMVWKMGSTKEKVKNIMDSEIGSKM